MRREIAAMIRSFALLVSAWAASTVASTFGAEAITATVGVTPSCPYGLAG